MMAMKRIFHLSSSIALLAYYGNGSGKPMPGVVPCDEDIDPRCVWKYLHTATYGYYDPSQLDANSEIEEWVKGHNFLRAWHKAPPMRWDEALAEKARVWATYLATGLESGKLKEVMGC
jgi:hypothetical protein